MEKQTEMLVIGFPSPLVKTLESAQSMRTFLFIFMHGEPDCNS
jgi:hypothetical protein